MYKVKMYSYNKANLYNVTITSSTHKNKKLDVFRNNVYMCSIGDTRYSDYPTYILTHGLPYANIRRTLYKRRHAKDRFVYGTAGYYADKLLW